nr:hypothetical protein [uncultured Rhodopila sp.]
MHQPDADARDGLIEAADVEVDAVAIDEKPAASGMQAPTFPRNGNMFPTQWDEKTINTCSTVRQPDRLAAGPDRSAAENR